jgi:NADH-quinone oxidoreductase subunit L
VARHFRPFAWLVERRFFVDEIYRAIVVRPIGWISHRAVWRGLDAILIDRMAVEGSGRVVSWLGTLASAAQTGVLQQYLLYLLLGAVAAVGIMAL